MWVIIQQRAPAANGHTPISTVLRQPRRPRPDPVQETRLAPFTRNVLIVARRKGQRIRIGDNIEVVVTELSRGEVRLGIIAPKTVPVVREEIRRAVEDANRAAAGSSLAHNDTVSEVVVVGDLGEVAGISSSSK